MPATTKDELRTVHAKEYTKLVHLLAEIQPDQALETDDDDTSVKDVVCHRAHWIGLFLGWYRDGIAGKETAVPAEGYKWNELKRYNAALRSKQQNISWDEALLMLRDAHQDLSELIEGLSEDDLYGGPMVGGHSKWTTGRWAEASGPSHYRSASKYVRARLRTWK